MTIDELRKKIDRYLNDVVAPQEGLYSGENVEWFMQLFQSYQASQIETIQKAMRDYREKYPDATYDDAVGVVMGVKAFAVISEKGKE